MSEDLRTLCRKTKTLAHAAGCCEKSKYPPVDPRIDQSTQRRTDFAQQRQRQINPGKPFWAVAIDGTKPYPEERPDTDPGNRDVDQDVQKNVANESPPRTPPLRDGRFLLRRERRIFCFSVFSNHTMAIVRNLFGPDQSPVRVSNPRPFNQASHCTGHWSVPGTFFASPIPCGPFS